MPATEKFEDATCDRCSAKLADVHPFGWAILDMTTPMGMASGNPVERAALCMNCFMDFGEFMCPGMREEYPAWVSLRDQAESVIKNRSWEKEAEE